MVNACVDDRLFENSFLSVLNRETHFGKIPDDLIIMIFEYAGYKVPDYKVSPLIYELKYFKKHNRVNNDMWYMCNYRLPDRTTIGNGDKYECLNTFSRGHTNSITIFPDFPFEIIKWIIELNGENLKKIFEWCENIASISVPAGAECLVKTLISAVHREYFLPPIPIDYFSTTDEQFNSIAEDYMDEVYDEYGAHHYLETSEYLKTYDIPQEGRGLCIFFNIFDQGTGRHIRTTLGQHTFYDREGAVYNGDVREIWINEAQHTSISNNYGGRYICRGVENIDKDDYDYTIKNCVNNLNNARRIFKKLLNEIKNRRIDRCMNILRYAKTGIEPTFERPKHNYTLMYHIRRYERYSDTGKKKAYISDTYDIVNNIFRINEYRRLERLARACNDKGEKMFYFIKLGTILCEDTNSNRYDVIHKLICECENDEKEAEELEQYRLYKSIGCIRDENEFITPPHNPHTYTRINLRMSKKVRYASMLLNPKDVWDYDRIEKVYKESNKY